MKAGFAIALGLTLSGCASYTPPPPAPAQHQVDEAWTPSKGEMKAWRSLLFRTDVKQVASDRLIVEAWGRPVTGIDKIEFRLLARAAAEAQRLGYSHFVFVDVRDRNLPKAGGLMPGIGIAPEDAWIGSYEDLVHSRYEREEAAAPKTWLVPGLEGIVIMLNETDARMNKSFSASETFDYLGRSGIAK